MFNIFNYYKSKYMHIIIKPKVKNIINHFFNDLYHLMNNKKFHLFYTKYFTNWNNITTLILYFKLYESINKYFIINYNRKITKKELTYVLHHMFKNTLIRNIIIQKFIQFQNNSDSELKFTMSIN